MMIGSGMPCLYRSIASVLRSIWQYSRAGIWGHEYRAALVSLPRQRQVCRFCQHEVPPSVGLVSSLTRAADA